MRPITILILACILASLQPAGFVAERSATSQDELVLAVSAAVPLRDSAVAIDWTKNRQIAKKVQEESRLQPYTTITCQLPAANNWRNRNSFAPLASSSTILQQLHVRLQP